MGITARSITLEDLEKLGSNYAWDEARSEALSDVEVGYMKKKQLDDQFIYYPTIYKREIGSSVDGGPVLSEGLGRSDYLDPSDVGEIQLRTSNVALTVTNTFCEVPVDEDLLGDFLAIAPFDCWIASRYVDPNDVNNRGCAFRYVLYRP